MQGCFYWLLSTSRYVPFWQAQDALHLGRYDMVPMVQTAETVESPQLQAIQVVDISFVAQWQFLMVHTVRRTIDIHQLLNTVADVPVVRSYRSLTSLSWRGCRFPWSLSFSSCRTLIRWSTSFVQVLQFSRADGEETVELPQLQPLKLWRRSLTCPLCATTGAAVAAKVRKPPTPPAGALRPPRRARRGPPSTSV